MNEKGEIKLAGNTLPFYRTIHVHEIQDSYKPNIAKHNFWNLNWALTNTPQIFPTHTTNFHHLFQIQFEIGFELNLLVHRKKGKNTREKMIKNQFATRCEIIFNHYFVNNKNTFYFLRKTYCF